MLNTSIILVLIVMLTLPVQSTLGDALFTDVATQSGLDLITYCGGTEKNHLLESVGSGAAFLDYDNDSDLDLYILSGWRLIAQSHPIKIPNRLYRNKGDGSFEDVTQQSGVGDESWSLGVCAADYNNDGFTDLYVTNFGANRLYKNNGDGTFTDVASSAKVADDSWSSGATFFDYDKDGDVDLYVANYVDSSFPEVFKAQRTLNWKGVDRVMIGPVGLKGAADIFYKNNGDGTFSEATVEAGLIDVGIFYGLGVCATDYDLDVDVDLYVANDSNPNYLYQNNGNRSFTEIGLFAGVAVSGAGAAQAGMGVDFGDFDNDGDFDAFVTNFTGEYSTLYRNNGNGMFEDDTEAMGLAEATYLPMSWGLGFFDYDNDADLDLFIANGHIYPQVDLHPQYGETYAQKNQLFRNERRRFEEVLNGGDGLQLKFSSRGLAFGDYDNDGDLDLIVINVDALPTLLRNEAIKERAEGGGRNKRLTGREGEGERGRKTEDDQNTWLMLNLIGTRSNRSGIGAIVRVKTGNLTQLREVRSGGSYVSQNDLRAHFGLGSFTKADLVEIRWPSGMRTTLTEVPAGQILKVIEP